MERERESAEITIHDIIFRLASFVFDTHIGREVGM